MLLKRGKVIVLFCAAAIALVAIFALIRTDNQPRVDTPNTSRNQLEQAPSSTVMEVETPGSSAVADNSALAGDERIQGQNIRQDQLRQSTTLPAATDSHSGIEARIDAQKSFVPEDPASNNVANWTPRDWTLGGVNLEAPATYFYSLASDFETVWSGAASASIKSIQARETLATGGVVQVASAGSLRGQRIKFSGLLRTESLMPGTPASAMIWFRADDNAGPEKGK